MQIRRAILILSVALLGAGQAHAERGNPPGRLAVVIAASDSTGFIDQWVSTPAGQPITIRPIHEIARGRTAHVAFIVTGHSLGPDGRARVDVAIRVRRPDGSIAYAEPAFAHVRGGLAVGFSMADPTLEFGPHPTDPTGDWRIEAVAHDRISRTSAWASYDLAVLP